jgi:hypothetical protein
MATAPKEQRPNFFEDSASDRLVAIVTALSTDVAAGFDRFATLERLLIAKGVLSEGEIDSYTPSQEELARRKDKHEAFIGRVFYILKQEYDALE